MRIRWAACTIAIPLRQTRNNDFDQKSKDLRKHSQNVGVLGELAAGDPTGDLSLNAEMRWETMANAGYLTPIDRFFVRNHAPTPRVTWRRGGFA